MTDNRLLIVGASGFLGTRALRYAQHLGMRARVSQWSTGASRP